MGDPMDYRLGGGPLPPLFNTSDRTNECLQSLPDVLETGELSDLTIICGNTRHRVHKLILSTGSRFFKVACTGIYKESDGEINLPDDHPAAVRKMIGYLYNVDYNPTRIQMPDYDDDVEAELSDTEYDAEARYRMKLFGAEFIERKRIKQLKVREWGGWKSGEAPISSQLCLQAKVYALGEKYGIQGLKKAAKGAFESEIQSGNVGVDEFAEAVEEVYTSTVSEDRGLRNVVVKMIEQDILLLDHVVVREVMRATDFALDVLLYMSQGMRSQARFKESPQTVNLRVWGSLLH
ncbi:kelch repeat and BTB domain protein [Fusarium sp. NRRL 52700]|nr:kelch repeat and BTB domain protein [Fusarium sp. NRRL 52700]